MTDDELPVDAAFLAAVGFRPVYNAVTVVTVADGLHLNHVPGAARPFHLSDGRFTVLPLPPMPTRGHVRRLLAALGVPNTTALSHLGVSVDAAGCAG